MSHIKDASLAPSGRKKIEWVRRFMPALTEIENRFEKGAGSVDPECLDPHLGHRCGDIVLRRQRIASCQVHFCASFGKHKPQTAADD